MKVIPYNELPPEFQTLYESTFAIGKVVPLGNLRFRILSRNFKKRTLTLEIVDLTLPEQSDIDQLHEAQKS